MNKYQKEIEKLLLDSEQATEKELLGYYSELIQEIRDIIRVELDKGELSESKRLNLVRLQSIQNQLVKKMNELEGEVTNSIYAYLVESGKLSYAELFYEFEMHQRIPINFDMLSDRILETIIQTPVAGRKLSSRLKGNIKKLKDAINHELVRGFGKGDSYEQMAQRLYEIGKSSYKRAKNIVRTEGGRVSGITRQKSQVDVMKQGVNVEKRWVSTLGKKTRDTHRQLDGQQVKIDAYFKSSSGHRALQPHMFGVASEDCNCRCTSISVIKGYEPSLRKDNETKEVDNYQTFNEWFSHKERV